MERNIHIVRDTQGETYKERDIYTMRETQIVIDTDTQTARKTNPLREGYTHTDRLRHACIERDTHTLRDTHPQRDTYPPPHTKTHSERVTHTLRHTHMETDTLGDTNRHKH